MKASSATAAPAERKTALERIRSVWKRDNAYYVMMIIPVLYFVIFCYVPMYGLIISFQDYRIGSSFFSDITWVGLKWFQEFFNSPFFGRVLRNTVLLSVYNIIFVFPLPIILALLFNEIKNSRVRGFAQTVSYLPYFISVTIVVGMMYNFLSVNGGIVNELLGRIGVASIDFMQTAAWFRPLYTASDAWQTVGFSSIIFVAAIAGINPEIYEAAFVDGSSRFRNILHITLPCIAPTIIVMLLLRLGSIMSVGFEKILLMYNPTTYDTADIISTFVYRNGIINRRYSFATAVDLFNSGINIIILYVANTISKKISDTSLW